MRSGLGFCVPHLGGGFVPTDIAGLVAWWDASDLATITASGGAVSQWDDKSGVGNHATQGTAGNKPTTGTRTQNGKNVLDFDGGDFLASAVSVADRTASVFAVVLVDSVAVEMSYSGSVPSAGLQLQSRDISGSRRLAVIKSGIAVLGVHNGATISASTPYVFSVIMDASTVQMGQNATYETDSDSTTFTAGRTLQIGATESTNAWDGWIAELIYYDSTVNNTDRDTVVEYLRSKWAVF